MDGGVSGIGLGSRASVSHGSWRDGALRTVEEDERRILLDRLLDVIRVSIGKHTRPFRSN